MRTTLLAIALIAAAGAPVAAQPAAGAPVVAQPVIAPVVARPAAGVSVAAQPVVIAPVVAQPAAGVPVVPQPAVGAPVAAQPAVSAPLVTQPVASAPLVTQPVASPPVAAHPDTGTARLKDVTSVQGAAATPLLGYGLVVGLNKTGDRRQTIFSAQTLANMLERFGIAVSPGEMKVENIAAVLVTGQMGPFTQTGSRMDVTASSIGDARSLQGGTLMPTPLRGPDGHVMALAQGPLTLGGFGAGGGGNSVQVNHLTVGRVPGGAVVQEARLWTPPAGGVLLLSLHEPDFVSAGRVAAAINVELGVAAARVVDAGAVMVLVPAQYQSALPDLIARLEPLAVALDTTARVVINERTGTVVMGGDVRLGRAAVAHGNLSVRIATQYDVSQPAPLSAGQTTAVPQTDVDVSAGDAKLVTLEAGATLSDVVRALNLLGVTPRDIIAVMQALKAAGALRAEIVVL